MKKVSVVIPCYNAENYIDRCISSLVCQTIGLEAMELIFVNDASGDRTIEHLRAWEEKYPDSIVVIDCEENHRTGGARNIGMRRASAKYIGFMDNDDVVEPDMYETLYQAAEKYGCDIAAACYDRVAENGVHYDFIPQGRKEIPVICAEREEGVADYPREVWNKIYRREVIFENDIFFAENIHYSENQWEFIVDYYIKSYYVVNKIMYHHMVNEKSILLSTDFNVHKDRLEAELKKLEEIERRGLEDIYSERLEKEFIELYYLNSLHLFLDRNTELDIDTLQEMKREVLSRYPNYRDNPIVQQMHMVHETDLFLLGTLEIDLSEEDWKNIAEAYRQGNHDVFIYMPADKARRWSMYMYQDFLQLRVAILDMLINYGKGFQETAVQWNGEEGLHNWKEFFSDYREVWGEFLASEDRLRDMTEKASMNVWCACDRKKLEQIESRLETAEDMAQVRDDMGALIKLWEDSRDFYRNYMSV